MGLDAIPRYLVRDLHDPGVLAALGELESIAAAASAAPQVDVAICPPFTLIASAAQQARTVGRMADGVVVGSALVDILGREGVGASRRFLGSLREALDIPEAQ